MADTPANLLDALDELLQLPEQERMSRLDSMGLLPADRERLLRWLEFGGAATTDGSSVLDHPPAVLSEAQQLLHGSSGQGVAQGVPSEELVEMVDSAGPPPSIPGYEIVDRLGHGGMATVWRARQVSTGRQVALKVMNPWLFSSPRARMRFDRELRLTARLQHPNIARVYDGGSAGGTSYYAMELIEGQHLENYAKAEKLGDRQILKLMHRVCLAVQQAHQRGIIHRDLKPSNILVDSAGEPHVLDFGLARALEEGTDDRITMTQDGAFAGTLAFMSPEQASGNCELADVRTDVYSLGATLYLLLTGSTPHDTSGPRHEVLRRIAKDPMRRPRSFREDLSAEVEAILLKALAARPEDRYASVAELAEDIQRYLLGRPILARSPSRIYVLGKWFMRHRLPVSVAAGVLLLILGTAIYAFIRIDAARKDALLARRNSEARLVELLIAQGDALAARAQWLDVLPLYEEAGEISRRTEADQTRADSALLSALNHAPPPLLKLAGHKGPVRCVAISPDDRHILTGSDDGTIRLWEMPGGTCIRVFEGHDGEVLCLEFSSDRKQFVSGDRKGTIILWDTAGSEIRRFIGHKDEIWSASISPDGRYLVSTSLDFTTRQWNLETGRQIRFLPRLARKAIFSRDGRCIFTMGDGLPNVWNADSGEALALGREGSVGTSIAASPDGQWIACGYWRDFTRLFRAELAQPANLFSGPSDEGVQFSGDSAKLLRWCSDGSLRVQDLASKAEDSVIWPKGAWGGAAWSSDGRWAVTGGQDGIARVWGCVPDMNIAQLPQGGDCNSVAVSPDGRLIATAAAENPSKGFDPEVRLWDRASGQLLMVAGGPHARTGSVTFSPDSRWLAFDRGELIYLLDLAEPTALQPLGYLDGAAMSIRFSPDGRRLLGATGVSLRVWDLPSRKRLWSAVSPAVLDGRVSFCRNGAWTAAATERGHALLYEVETGKPVSGVLPDAVWGNERFGKSAFLSDGRTAFAKRTATGDLHLFDTFTGKLARELKGPACSASAMTVSTDDRWGISVGDAVWLWDLAGGKLVRVIGTHAGPVNCVDCTPDGKLIVTGGQDTTCRIWDLSRPAKYRSLQGSADSAMQRLGKNADDASALAVLGEWYAFRNEWHWAAEALGRARAGGAEVSSLMLGRAYWRIGRRDAARTEFQRARQRREAPEWYLKLCLRAIDGMPKLQLTNAILRGRQGDFKGADAEYDRQIAEGPSFPQPYLVAIALKLHFGDIKAYRRICAEMLQRLQNTMHERDARVAARGCLLLPEVTEDVDLIRRLIARDAAENPHSTETLAAMALLCLRTNDPEHAAEYCQRILTDPNVNGLALAEAGALLANAQQKLGRDADAAASLERASAAFRRYDAVPGSDWSDRIIVRLFLREAESLICGAK